MPPLYSYIQKLNCLSLLFFFLAVESYFVQLLRRPHQRSCFSSRYSHTPNYTTWSKDRPPNKLCLSAFSFLHFKRQLFSVHLAWCLTWLVVDADSASELKLILRPTFLGNISSKYFISRSYLHETTQNAKWLTKSKSSIFWDITPCGSLKINRRFGGKCRHLLRPWRWRRHFPPKCRLTFNWLHGVISQKIELFITTAVRTSNPTSAGTLGIKWLCINFWTSTMEITRTYLYTCVGLHINQWTIPNTNVT
jgi:hypothetical protein